MQALKSKIWRKLQHLHHVIIYCPGPYEVDTGPPPEDIMKYYRAFGHLTPMA